MQAERMQNRKFYYAQYDRFNVVKIAFYIRHYNVKADRTCCPSVITTDC